MTDIADLHAEGGVRLTDPQPEDVRLHERRRRDIWRHAFDNRDLATVLSALYDHEINVGMQSFWDGGWTVWFGAGLAWGDVKVEEHFSRDAAFGEIADWLVTTAESHYPSLKTGRFAELAHA